MSVQITKDKIICDRSELNIVRTVCCGQVFRYFDCGDGSFELASADKRCKLYYEGDKTVILTDSPEYFYNYFDFDTNYAQIINELRKFEELSGSLGYAEGLRILRQQPFETVVSFIISANNNIKRIKGIIERICRKCYSGDGEIPPFPDLESLSKLTEEDYAQLGCGFRSRYLYDTVPKLTAEYLDYIGSLEQNEAKKQLCSLMGVGPKVADCILLFGYKKTESYPVDTWIFKAGKTDELNTPQKVHEYYSRRYGKLSGYAQQYIFYSNQQKAAV